MPGYVPPHLRGKAAAAAAAAVAPRSRHIRFIGNATGNVNVVSSKGKRFTPRRSAAAARRTLKAVRIPTPNAKPLWEPSHALRAAAPKFAKAALNHLGLAGWQVAGPGRKKRRTHRAKKVHKN